MPTGVYRRPSAVVRFWSKVDKEGPVHPLHGSCWQWTGRDPTYGRVTTPKGRKGAHHFSWETFRGKIPKGLYVLHKCDNQKCVNPDHLFLGTQKDNVQDMTKKGRHGRPRLKVSDEAAEEIRRRFVRYSPKRTNARLLALEYGISRRHVRAIATRKKRRYV